MVEFVTGIKMDSDGVATSQGHAEDGVHELDSETAWHFGFYSRPKDGARGVVLKADGQGNTSFLIGYRDKQYELSLNKGEVGAKNAFDAYWLLNQSGELELNGTGQKLLMADDFIADYKDFVNRVLAVISSNCINGAPLTAYPTYAAALGAYAAQLAVSGSYRSVKVKNG